MASTRQSYNKVRVLSIARAELAKSEGYIADEVQMARIKALEYYYGRPRGDEIEGLSKVQSLDVADMTEACLSFMVPALTSESLIQFSAVGAEDEPKAASESRVVQAMIRAGGSNAYIAIAQAVKDALLQRLAIIKVWIESTSDVERESLELPGDKDGPDMEMLSELLSSRQQEGGDNVTVSVGKTSAIPKTKGGGWRVELVTETREHKLKLAAVDPDNFYWSTEATQGADLDALRAIFERQLLSRSALIDEGFDEAEVMNLPPAGVEWRAAQTARRRGRTARMDAEDVMQELIEIHRCYLLLGTGEGGRAERWLVTMAARSKILDREKVECVPYGVGAAIMDAHTVEGLSLYDKLKEVQDTKTGALRAWLNNLQFVNRPRAAILENAVNEDDFYNVEVGGGVKVMKQGAIEWLQVPDIGASCLQALGYQDKMRAERGGASLELMGPNLQLNSPTATGTEREISVKEQLAALMARNLGETLLRRTYLVAHYLCREMMQGELEVKDGGEWVKARPGSWPERDDVAIVIGLSPGERARRLSALQAVIGQQEKLLLNGQEGVLVTVPQYYTALLEWARASGLDTPEKYLTNPASEQSKAAAQKREADMRRIGTAQAELAKMLETMKAQVEAFKQQSSDAVKYFQEYMKAEIEEMKVIGAATASLEAAKGAAVGASSQSSAAASRTTELAGANAKAPTPQAGQLPPGGVSASAVAA